MSEVYPVGTALRLKENNTDVTIIGYARKDPNTGKQYDYLGVNASYGLSLTYEMILFNEDQIEEILQEGFKDVDFEDFTLALKASIQKTKEKDN